MNKFLKTATLLALALVVTLTGCGSQANNNAAQDNQNNQNNVNQQEESTDAKDVTLEEVDTIEDGDQVIDIRPTDYYIGWENEEGVSGHIKDAIDFPAEWFEYEQNPEYIDIELERRHIDKDKKTVLYVDDEVSPEDFQKFADAGFESLYVLKGGINQYAKDDGELERLEGYEQYVSPQWVQDLIDGKKPEGYDGEKFQIVEVSLPPEVEEEYEAGHIKGAVDVNADDINHIPGPRTVQEYEGIPMDEQLKFWGFRPDDEIKEVIENLGIDQDTTVILYATDKATTGSYRTALVMDYAGVKDIRFMNGGKTRWNLESRPLDKETVEVEKANLTTNIPVNPDIVFDYDKELELIDDPNAVIASVRSWDEFLSKISGYTYIDKAGDIKNSRFAYAGSDPYAMEDYRNLDNTVFNYKLCADRWERWGITPDKTVSFHCGTGWRASETYYLAKAMGWDDVGVYVGGWYEWTHRPDSPVKPEGLPNDAPEQEPEEFFYKSEEK